MLFAYINSFFFNFLHFKEKRSLPFSNTGFLSPKTPINCITFPSYFFFDNVWEKISLNVIITGADSDDLVHTQHFHNFYEK